MLKTRAIWIVIFALVAAACDHSAGVSTTAPATQAAAQTDSGPSLPRIVSMVPAATLNLVLIGAGDRLVGVTKYDGSFLPEGEKNLPIVGDYETMNLERLVDLHPTAVVVQMSVAHLPENFRSVAESHHFEVLNLKLDTVEDMWTEVHELGRISGKGKEADALVAQGKKDLAAIGEEIKGKPRVKVAYIVGKDPLYVAGGKTFLDEMITLAGGDNVGAKVGDFYPAVSKEMLAGLGPQVLLISAPEEPEQQANDPRVDMFMTLPIAAAREHRIWLVTDSDSLIASVDLAKHVRALAELLHRNEVPQVDGEGGK